MRIADDSSSYPLSGRGFCVVVRVPFAILGTSPILTARAPRAKIPAMTVPSLYIHASRDFERFLLDARDELSLPTTNAAYAAVLAVFVTFRARLTPEQALVFADALPAVLGAMLLREWDIAPPKPFADRATLTREAQTFRPDHTLLPDSGIADTTRVLRRHVDPAGFERALKRLPEGARAFWAI